MMKKLTALVMLLVMALCCCTAQADGTMKKNQPYTEMKKFQPYTDVKIDVLKKYGFTTKNYDDFAFTAEFKPSIDTISHADDYDTYTIQMDIKVVCSGNSCTLVPRLIFTRKGTHTYYDNHMETVYIRCGENRYKVDVSGCSRYSKSEKYGGTATDSSVEILCYNGIEMLKDIANSDDEIHVKFDYYGGNDITLSAENKKALTNFYNACLEAGIYSQEALFAMQDDYSVITLFNNK